jgi:hypothetical protein
MELAQSLPFSIHEIWNHMTRTAKKTILPLLPGTFEFNHPDLATGRALVQESIFRVWGDFFCLDIGAIAAMTKLQTIFMKL